MLENASIECIGEEQLATMDVLVLGLELTRLHAEAFTQFATAAYGPQVIANAVFESGERVPPAPTASTQSAVMKHVGIENNDES
jgi:hypothetical protein